MSRMKMIEKDGLLPEQVNPELWPIVDEKMLSNDNLALFQNRKQAVILYFNLELNQEQIHELTGVSPRNLRRLINRCITLDTSGIPWGFRALIPNKSTKPYSLNLLKQKQNELRKTGEFKMLLEKYPAIKELIDDLYLGRNRKTLEPAMKPKNIHKKFVDACKEHKIPLTQYPFNTERLGIRALYRYLRRLGEQNFGKTSSRYGHDAEQKATKAGKGDQNSPVTLTPYQKVQFDAHRIDGVFAVELKTPEGDSVLKILERFWILTLIDVATRSVIGKTISLNKEYSAADFMLCMRDAIVPHVRPVLTINGLTFNGDGGYPSEVYPELQWAVFDVICFDNAKSHLANLVKDRLRNLLGCTTNLGPVDLPMRRGIIERFFQTLEENGFHRLPNTTGSHPNDPRRSKPEEKAIQYKITFDNLKELVEVLISNYNGTPHGGIYHQTPLELLGKRLANGMIPRQLEESKRSEMLFLQTTIVRTVRGSLKTGKRPYIQYEGVEYRSERLSQSAHLIGKDISLHVNVDDLRTLRAFLPDGSELGYLSATGKWSITPHTLQMRKAINQLVLRRHIHFTQWDDPIFVYTTYLMNKAIDGKKKDANKLTHVQEIIKDASTSRNSLPEEQKEALDQATKTNEALDRARQMIREEKERHSGSMDEFLAKYKTITF
ncbi:hypothetical protein [Paenibacillus elgii]|uniref:hypothetical protein n=1 Tax=Paenibacillus elgii TaxID=189691 RepID=UPI000248CA21|nr:hypothetical protein [Paenibacillus elgii]